MSQVDNRNSFAGKRARTDGGRREDDWTCPNCGNVNFSFRTTCNMRNCTQSRPVDHNVKSTPKSLQGPPPFTSAAGYVGSTVPSSIYGGAPYGSSYFNGSPLPPYDLPGGGSGYPYGYGGRLSVGSPYGPLHMSGPPPYSGGSMVGAGSMYGMAPLMDRYGMGLHMGHGPMGPSRPGAYPEDFQKKPAGRDNDWICPNCGNRNFAFRDICNMRKCNTPRPGNQGTKSENSKGSKPKMPEGSWKCEKCNNINYPFRTKCNRQNCGAERPSEENQARGLTSDEDEQVMPMRGRRRAYWGPSSSSTLSVTETEVEEEVVAEVEAEDVLDEQPPTDSRRVIEATTTKVFTDPQAVRRATDILKRRWITPWTTWRDVSGVERDAMFEYFMRIYTCAAEDMGSIRSTWEASMQRRLTGTLQRARRDAIAASGSHDMTAWLPHHPRWMSPDVWAQMIGKWNNEEWRQRSQTARQNRLTLKEGEVTKYAGGSIPLIAHKERMAKSQSKVPSHAEVFKKTHTRKGTEDFVDARSRKVMEDYNAAFSEKYDESSPPPVDFDGEAWMRAAGDTSRGRVYGFSAGDSPGECSSAPHRRRASQRIQQPADDSSASDQQLERVVERVIERLSGTIERLSGTNENFIDARIMSILNRRLGKEPVAPETDEVEDENEDEGGD